LWAPIPKAKRQQIDTGGAADGLCLFFFKLSPRASINHSYIFSKTPDFPIFRTFKQIDLIEQIVLIMLTWTVKNVIGHCSYYTATVLEGYNSKVIATGD